MCIILFFIYGILLSRFLKPIWKSELSGSFFLLDKLIELTCHVAAWWFRSGERNNGSPWSGSLEEGGWDLFSAAPAMFSLMQWETVPCRSDFGLGTTQAVLLLMNLCCFQHCLVPVLITVKTQQSLTISVSWLLCGWLEIEKGSWPSALSDNRKHAYTPSNCL